MRLSRAIFLFIIGVFIAQAAYYFPILPPTVASHFNAAGNADNWMSKEWFLVFQIVILAVIIGIAAVLPLLLEKLPDALINLPNRQYWLAPARRTQTFATLRIYFEWFGVGLLLLFVLINQQVYRANINNHDLSPASWLIVAGFVIFTIVWMIKFVGQFKIKE